MSELLLNHIYQGNAKDVLKTFPDKVIKTTVTSPPYFCKRDYQTGTWEGGDPDCDHSAAKNLNKNATNHSTLSGGLSTQIQSHFNKSSYKGHCKKCGAVRIDEQIGNEKTPEEYVENLCEIFDEVYRVTSDDGTLWLNLGDSYTSAGGNYSANGSRGVSAKVSSNTQKAIPVSRNIKIRGLKPKDLIGIPWMVAVALRDRGAADVKSCRLLERVMSEILSEYQDLKNVPDKMIQVLERLQKEYSEAKGNSWYLRQDIIWSKPNCMPESVTDRCTIAHEYVFMLSKKSKYFYDADAIKEEGKNPTDDIRRIKQQHEKNKSTPDQLRNGLRTRKYKNLEYDGRKPNSFHLKRIEGEEYINLDGKANKRSVWSIATKPFLEAHYAVMPDELASLCIKAGSVPGDVVCDPFAGAGTTPKESVKLGRKFVAIELNPKNIDLANRRLSREVGLFL